MGSPRLGDTARKVIEDAEARDGLFMSATTLWEIAMLAERGRIDLNIPTEAWLDAVARAPNLHIVQLSPGIAVDSVRLVGFPNRDPADRIIIATARSLDASVLSADRDILDYGGTGAVSVLDATG